MSSPKAPGAKCDECPASGGVFVPPEPARGRTRLAIVGESPGAAELEVGRPFVGPSGRMLGRELGRKGVMRADCHITNAVLCACRPSELKKARKACAERLRLELAAAAPPVVMALGALGMQSAMTRGRPGQILKWRGSISRVDYAPQGVLSGTAADGPQHKGGNRSPGEPSPKERDTAAHDSPGICSIPPGGALVLPTIHPAFVMRAPQWASVFAIDVARVVRYVEGAIFVPPEEQPGRRIVIAKTIDELASLLDELDAEDEAFDVETVGLGPTTTRLVCFGLSSGPLTVIVPWSLGRDGRDPWWPNGAAASVAGMVSSHWRRRRVITHNGPAFDHIVAGRYNLRIAAWGDTLLAAHATEPWLPRGLSSVVTRVIDVGPWKELEDRTADLPRLWIYNGRDTLYTKLAWDLKKEAIT